MIHDAIVPVTCDNLECKRYRTKYWPYESFLFSVKIIKDDNPDPADIEWDLMDHGWIIKNGKHYCSEACASEAEDGKD